MSEPASHDAYQVRFSLNRRPFPDVQNVREVPLGDIAARPRDRFTSSILLVFEI
jgi:hypothetical protein